MENNAKKITGKIIEKMNTKLDELSTRIETKDRKAEAEESLTKQNQNNISNLTSESTALQKKVAEQTKKIHEHHATQETTTNIQLKKYNIEHVPTESANGGVFLYIKKAINYKKRELESAFIEIIQKEAKTFPLIFFLTLLLLLD